MVRSVCISRGASRPTFSDRKNIRRNIAQKCELAYAWWGKAVIKVTFEFVPQAGGSHGQSSRIGAPRLSQMVQRPYL